MARDEYYRQKELKQKLISAEIIEELPKFTHTFFNNYCRSTRGLSERTITEYARDLRVFFRYLQKKHPELENQMSNITPEFIGAQTILDLQDFLSYLSAYKENEIVHSNNAAGLNRKVAALRTFYKYYFATGAISANPAAILTAPRIKTKEIVWLEREESDRMLALVDQPEQLRAQSPLSASWSARFKYRDKAIIVLLLGTGIRISECVGLNLSDFNWMNRSALIIRKGGNEQTIYFNGDVEKALTEYIAHERLVPKKEDSDALFISRNHTRMTVRSMERMIEKYASVAVPQKRITAHKMRSTFATQLGQANNGNIMQVRAALGHTTIEMSRRYVDVSSEERQLVSALTNWTHIFDAQELNEEDADDVPG